MSPGFLATMGTRLVAGREYDWHDVEDMRPVALVSENLARNALGRREGGARTADPHVGRRGPLARGRRRREDVRMNGPDQAPPTTIYWPALNKDFYRGLTGLPSCVASRSFCAQPQAGNAALARELESAVWSVKPERRGCTRENNGRIFSSGPHRSARNFVHPS
jgi:hypothetical protein